MTNNSFGTKKSKNTTTNAKTQTKILNRIRVEPGTSGTAVFNALHLDHRYN